MDNVIEITGHKPKNIKLFPDTIAEEIIQNIETIITTPIGSVPLDRGFGVDMGFVDNPLPRAMMKAAIFIAESVQELEPRVEVKEIEFIPSLEDAIDGKIVPKVKVRILDEYLSP